MNFLDVSKSSTSKTINYGIPTITEVNPCDGVTSDYIYDLYTQGLQLKKPILINIEYECGDLVVTQDALNLWISGRNLKIIEGKMAKLIVGLFKELQSLNSEKLGPFPQKCLTFLNEHIEKLS